MADQVVEEFHEELLHVNPAADFKQMTQTVRHLRQAIAPAAIGAQIAEACSRFTNFGR